VTLEWLKKYVDIEESAEEVAALLTRQGLEVSEVVPVRPHLEGVITSRVVSLEPHPSSHGLWVCRMDTGKEDRTVLCGAQNVAVGDCVPLAVPGTSIPSGRVIEATTLHGVFSEGMLCSELELELSEDHAGIMKLPKDTSPGVELARALTLEDDVLDIEVTPNRPDCLSVIGVAREIAAKKNRALRVPAVSLDEQGPSSHEASSVEIIAPEACPRYVARLIEGVEVAVSPFWLRRLLSLVGLRPINNIVDVTNFVMLEWGQPLHAFDLDRLEENRIIVRMAGAGETLTTLDGEERRLSQEDLLICDARRPVALAGVMGGLESEIGEQTTRVLLESAFFEPRGIRRTGKRLGLCTEASYRFEREIDREGSLRAADRASEMMTSLAGGRVLAGALDVYPLPLERKRIQVKVSRINRLLGTSIEKDEVLRTLEALEMQVKDGQGETFDVTPPSFRPDIRMGMDIVEEVARLYGYDAIPTHMPEAPVSVVHVEPERRAEDLARDVLVGMGFSEVVNYSFSGLALLEPLGFPAGDVRAMPVPLQNPLSESQGFLRTTLIGLLLDTVARNLRQRNRDLKLFELGRVFLPRAGQVLPDEKRMLAGVLVGRRHAAGWNQPEAEVDLFDLKGALEVLFDAFGIGGFEWNPSEEISCLHPGCSGDILINTTKNAAKIGYAGRLHPQVQEILEIEEDIYLFELEFDSFTARVDRERRYRPYAKRPPVQRDLALVLDEQVTYRQVIERMWELADSRVTEIELFDLYQGPPVPEGKKSMAFRITYQEPSRNLTDEEINTIQEAFLGQLLPGLRAHLR
jgi:phenylalanyl-tRNA synthetase beta chain